MTSLLRLIAIVVLLLALASPLAWENYKASVAREKAWADHAAKHDPAVQLRRDLEETRARLRALETHNCVNFGGLDKGYCQ